MRITSELYVDFLRAAYDRIHANETYVTDLDLATGDGDHWSNLDKGFRNRGRQLVVAACLAKTIPCNDQTFRL